jgi:O-antigen/teichoic acid export membrane protein
MWWPDVTVLGGALAIPVVATLLAAFGIVVRLSREAAGASGGRAQMPRPSPARTSRLIELRRDVLPIGLGILLSALYFRIDVFLVERWHGMAAVGLYGAVFRLVDALRLFPAAVMAVALPSLCRATSARPLARVAWIVTGVGVGAAALLWVSAAPIVALLYGQAYEPAVPAFRVLLLSFPLMSLNYALTHQLIGWNGHHAYAALAAAALAVNVALNVRLVPDASIVGAAWATVWTEVVVAIGCAAAILRRAPRAAYDGSPAGASS